LPDFASGVLPIVREAVSIGMARYATHQLLEVAMKVFTSIFVVESLRTAFDEMAEAGRPEIYAKTADEAEASRRHVVDLHVKIEAQRDRTDGRA
jgi:hypothetical protein